MSRLSGDALNYFRANELRSTPKPLSPRLNVRTRLQYSPPEKPLWLYYRAVRRWVKPRRPGANERTRLGFTPPFDGEYLTTFAPNTLPLTGFFDSSIVEKARNNAAALVLALTAAKHTADLAVTAGHRHDALYTRLWWRQIAQWTFAGYSGVNVGPLPGELYGFLGLNSVATVTLAFTRGWAQPVDMSRVVPRIRITNDNSATNTTTITLEFYNPSTLALLTSTTIVFSTAVARTKAWLEALPIDLSAGLADPGTASRIPLLVKIKGAQSAANEPVGIHELQLGVLP